MNSKRSPSTYWPVGIIAAFVIFIATMAVWIAFAVSQKMDLVRPDYYEEELRYQNHLDSVIRARPFSENISIRYDAGNRHVVIGLPPFHVANLKSGKIQLYRPSDAKLDLELTLEAIGGTIRPIPAENLHTGLWRVRLYWEVAGSQYYADQRVVIGSQHASKGL